MWAECVIARQMPTIYGRGPEMDFNNISRRM